MTGAELDQAIITLDKAKVRLILAVTRGEDKLISPHLTFAGILYVASSLVKELMDPDSQVGKMMIGTLLKDAAKYASTSELVTLLNQAGDKLLNI